MVEAPPLTRLTVREDKVEGAPARLMYLRIPRTIQPPFAVHHLGRIYIYVYM